MSKTVLITGGAGFIGSHLADTLLLNGYNVKVFDNLTQQVHNNSSWPSYLSKNIELIKGNICDFDSVKSALKGVNAVFHFAASVGVGQSMYKIYDYTLTNNLGTAVLLECIIQCKIERLIIASSMSVYGEGLYKGPDGTILNNVERSIDLIKKNQWEPVDSNGYSLVPVPTPESKAPALASVYALSKYGQERMACMLGIAYSIPTVALRFFNVYGSRQSLSNPYTGVLAIFASRLLNGKSPVIFEDGMQKRDFVNIKDVCNACRLALECPDASGKVFNIGSGVSYTIYDIACKMNSIIGKNSFEPVISAKYRFGDIRHCFADISLAKEVLGYLPTVSLESGLVEFAQWLQGQLANDKIELANAELLERGLTV